MTGMSPNKQWKIPPLTLIHITAGTSMASPAAAGNALLVREYFEDPKGLFWTKVCRSSYRSCHSFSPSGVLVKTILLHSGAAMALYHGGGDYDIRLGSPPDSIQGFGRIALYRALPLTSFSTKFDLFVADLVNTAESSDVRYNVQVQSNTTPLRYSLRWC